MSDFKKASDGSLEITRTVVTKVSLEEIDAILAATQEEKNKAIAHVAALDDSVAYYEGLKTQAMGLGVVSKVSVSDGEVK
jgi:hypothetical protein